MLQKHVRVLLLMYEDSSRKEVVSEKNELLNKSINKSTIITSFSIRPRDTPILEQFKEIAKREAGSRSFSAIILKALEEYNRRHEAGTPQLKLTPYIDEQAQNQMRVLCIDVDGAISDGRIHCKRAGMWIKGIRCSAATATASGKPSSREELS
jgi:hypothetical protein